MLSFWEHYQNVKQFKPRSGPTDLSPKLKMFAKFISRMTKVAASKQRVKIKKAFFASVIS